MVPFDEACSSYDLCHTEAFSEGSLWQLYSLVVVLRRSVSLFQHSIWHQLIGGQLIQQFRQEEAWQWLGHPLLPLCQKFIPLAE